MALQGIKGGEEPLQCCATDPDVGDEVIRGVVRDLHGHDFMPAVGHRPLLGVGHVSARGQGGCRRKGGQHHRHDLEHDVLLGEILWEG